MVGTLPNKVHDMMQRKLSGFNLAATTTQTSPGFFEPCIHALSDDGAVIYWNVCVVQNMEACSEAVAMRIAEEWLECIGSLDDDGRLTPSQGGR